MAEPKIRYARTTDGVAIAYTVVGEGPPLLYARRFLASGIDDEINFSFSNWPPLARVRSVVLWDMRGAGLSEAAPNAAFDDWVRDMEALVDALGVDRVDLGGELTPCHFVIAFAARHPESVGRIVLWNPPPLGFSPRVRQPAWLRDLASQDWDAYADVMSLTMFGWSRAPAGARFAERLRQHFTHDQFERMMDNIESISSHQLARDVRAPTLILSDQNLFTERAGDTTYDDRLAFMRGLAADIPSAEFAVIKPGDPTEAGRLAVRFLEPSAPEAAGASSGLPGTAIILFVDIAASTALTEQIGDAAFREKARVLDTALRVAVRDNGGAIVDAKTLGDGILATFPAASPAIAAALSCRSSGEAQGLQLHIGLHAGDIIREDDNVYGGAVNIAARVCALSQPGEILVSDTVRSLARTSAGVQFEDRGEHALKGIDDPLRIYAVSQP